MKSNLTYSPKVEQDYLVFFIFMTLVLAGMSVVSFIQNPALRQFWPATLFTILMTAHILLHWAVIRIGQKPSRQVWYILGQGLLAFVLVQLSGNTTLIFALYMALIGETIGFLGITRWGLLSTFYFLSLSLVNFVLFTDSNFTTALFWILTAVPIVIVVGMYVTLYLRQTEAREKAQALAAELSEYVARVEDLTITNERQRMARELHDTLSQGLAGLILQLEAADAHLSQQRPEKARAIITQAMEHARATLSDARNAIGDLRQAKGELGDSLRLEISRFESATGLPCVFHADSTPPILDPVKETILRAVSEALTNIASHARATQVSVTLSVTPTHLQITIQDNGIGFDPENIPSGHYGILGMRERIRLTGGQLSLTSAPQKGTILQISIPITQSLNHEIAQ